MFLRNVANTQLRDVTSKKTGPLKCCAVTTSNQHGKEMPEKMAVRGAEILKSCDIIKYSSTPPPPPPALAVRGGKIFKSKS